MTKSLTSLTVILLATNLNFAQVGIGTETPKAMLDVAGTVMVRDTTTLKAPLKLDYIESQTITTLTGDEIVLMADLADQKIVKRVSLDNLSTGLGPYNLNRPNPSVYYSRISSGLNLVTIGLFNSWQPVIFPAASKVTGNSSNVDTNGVYTAPSNGTYSITFNLRLGNGIEANVLSGNPQIGILKRTSGGSFSVLETKSFPGLSVMGVISLTIAELNINSLHELNQGDRIYFALVRGGIAVSLLNSGSASYQIYKIAGKTP